MLVPGNSLMTVSTRRHLRAEADFPAAIRVNTRSRRRISQVGWTFVDLEFAS